MEGPSLYLAAEQLKSFKGERIHAVRGNSKAGIERLEGKIIRDIFSWGKHLVFQFDNFAMRIHFMLFGTFEARVDGAWVTGDYRRAREPRLAMNLPSGEINTYNCSIRFFDTSDLRSTYDFSRDIMHRSWNPDQALAAMRAKRSEEIADVLLDQDIFAGVGNIIKNEVLSIAHVRPTRRVRDLPVQKRRELIETTRAFSKQFLAWRRKFLLRKHLKVHRRGTCPYCGGKLIRRKTGRKDRWSYWCPTDQK